ncbi:MAG: hypothetical protein ABF379_10525 [Akkermansiaceae bacterium]
MKQDYHTPAKLTESLACKLALTAMLLFLPSKAPAQSGTVTFTDWTEVHGIVDDATSPQTLQIVQDGVTFALTVEASNGKFQVSGNGGLIPANSGNRWEPGDGTLTLSLAVSGAALDALSLKDLTVTALNVDVEAVEITDGGNAVTGRGANPAAGEIDGPIFTAAEIFGNGSPANLTTLTKDNVTSWTLAITPAEGPSSGFGPVSFDYTVGSGGGTGANISTIVKSGNSVTVDFTGSGLYQSWKSTTLEDGSFTGPVKSGLSPGTDVEIDDAATEDAAYYILLPDDETP